MFRNNRWTSKVLWLSIASFITFLIKHFYDIELPLDMLAEFLLTAVTLFGIINDPTRRGRL